MCLSIPAKIIEINGATGIADCDGNKVEVNLSLLKEIQITEF